MREREDKAKDKGDKDGGYSIAEGKFNLGFMIQLTYVIHQKYLYLDTPLCDSHTPYSKY